MPIMQRAHGGHEAHAAARGPGREHRGPHRGRIGDDERRGGHQIIASTAAVASAAARARFAASIVITASGSPLAAAGDIHLAADHPEGYDRYSPMVSRLLHLMIIDILATCVALGLDSRMLQPMLQDMKNKLRSKRYT
jgi:hypothetical protein